MKLRFLQRETTREDRFQWEAYQKKLPGERHQFQPRLLALVRLRKGPAELNALPYVT
jgi:hypothetical protein